MEEYRAKSNFIIFSDVHLGADLVHHVRPWTLSRLKQVARIDRDLAAMLDWYRANADPAHPWRLIIAGDLVDFIGMSIAPANLVTNDLNDEEREFGLGSTQEQAAEKMRAVAVRHALVFEKLASFVADGHSIALVRGNHDVDFHWDSAQRAFVDALLTTQEDIAASATHREAFDGRVEFYPWFYYEEGLLYVEHGHQFDAMCSYHHLLAPVSPLDPRRISWSFSDILLRQVVRPTPGIGSEGHEHRGILDYVRFGLALGVRGAFRLAFRYFFATGHALRRWRAHLGAQARQVKIEHDAKLEALAERMRVGADKLRALSALWPGPVTRGGFAVLRSMFLDRLLLVLCVTAVLAVLSVLVPMQWWLAGSVAMLAGVAGFWWWSAHTRKFDLDPSIQMFLGVKRIAKLMPSRFIVMGHTHTPMATRVSDDVTYVNLGNWATDDVDGGEAHEPPRTHLVLRWIDGVAKAEFMKWNPLTGPEPGPELPRTHRPPSRISVIPSLLGAVFAPPAAGGRSPQDAE